MQPSEAALVAEAPSAPNARDGAFAKDLATWPNVVSIARVVVIYAAIALWHLDMPRLALFMGVLAGLSDYLDGYLARKLKQSTRIGGLIDQAADILFMTGCITVFVHDGTWPPALLYVVIFREVIVLNLRASAGEMGFSLPSSFLGKWASNWMFYALAIMAAVKGHVLPAAIEPWVKLLAHFGIVVGVGSSVVAGVLYFKSYARQYVAKPRG